MEGNVVLQKIMDFINGNAVFGVPPTISGTLIKDPEVAERIERNFLVEITFLRPTLIHVSKKSQSTGGTTAQWPLEGKRVRGFLPADARVAIYNTNDYDELFRVENTELGKIIGMAIGTLSGMLPGVTQEILSFTSRLYMSRFITKKVWQHTTTGGFDVEFFLVSYRDPFIEVILPAYILLYAFSPRNLVDNVEEFTEKAKEASDEDHKDMIEKVLSFVTGSGQDPLYRILTPPYEAEIKISRYLYYPRAIVTAVSVEFSGDENAFVFLPENDKVGFPLSVRVRLDFEPILPLTGEAALSSLGKIYSDYDPDVISSLQSSDRTEGTVVTVEV